MQERLDARELLYAQLDHFLDFVTSPHGGQIALCREAIPWQIEVSWERLMTYIMTFCTASV